LTSQQNETDKKKKTDQKDLNFNIEYDVFAQDGKFKILSTNESKVIPFHKGNFFIGDVKTGRAFYVSKEDEMFWEMSIEDMIEMINLPAPNATFMYVDLFLKSTKANWISKLLGKMAFSFKGVGEKVEITQLPEKIINGKNCNGKSVKLSYDLSLKAQSQQKEKKEGYEHQEATITFYSFVDDNNENAFKNLNWHKLWLVTGDKAFDKEQEKKLGFLGIPMEVNLLIKENQEEIKGEAKITEIKFGKIPEDTFQIPKGYENLSNLN
jgi:hypothetical protein